MSLNQKPRYRGFAFSDLPCNTEVLRAVLR